MSQTECRDLLKRLRRFWSCCSGKEFIPQFPLKSSIRNWVQELPRKCSCNSSLFALLFFFLHPFFFLLCFLFFPLFPSSLERDFPVCMNFHGHSRGSLQHFKHFSPARAAGKAANVHRPLSKNLGVFLCHKIHGKRREGRRKE